MTKYDIKTTQEIYVEGDGFPVMFGLNDTNLYFPKVVRLLPMYPPFSDCQIGA